MPTRPTMLNQPVIQLQPLPPRVCAHQYGPPAVGYFDVSSAIENATIKTKKHSTGQPIEAAIGPPFCQANANVVNVPASTEMIVNEIAKLVNPLHARERSCLYPSAASWRSSSVAAVAGRGGTSGVVIQSPLSRFASLLRERYAPFRVVSIRSFGAGI